MFLLIFIVTAGLAGIVIIALRSDRFDAPVATGIASAIAGIISSLVILPRIIAKYLFPNNEDDIWIKLINKMQREDSK